MSGELHGISTAIGSLQAQAEEHQRQTTAIFQELKDLNDKVGQLLGLRETVKDMQPIVRDLERDRIERNTRVASISSFAGGGIATVIEALSHFARARGWWS